MIETEVKLKLSKEEFLSISNQFRGVPFIDQRNILYEIPKGFVRIRRIGKIKTITIKREIQGEFNSRKEIEFQTISDLDVLKEFFRELGLVENLIYSKRRADITRNSCALSLDLLGSDYYLEIEGSPDMIRQNLKELGLENHKLETKSYLEILK